MLDDEIGVDEGKAEIKALDARRKQLQAQLDTTDQMPALLHPEMAACIAQRSETWPRLCSSLTPASPPPKPCAGSWTPSR